MYRYECGGCRSKITQLTYLIWRTLAWEEKRPAGGHANRGGAHNRSFKNYGYVLTRGRYPLTPWSVSSPTTSRRPAVVGVFTNNHPE